EDLNLRPLAPQAGEEPLPGSISWLSLSHPSQLIGSLSQEMGGSPPRERSPALADPAPAPLRRRPGMASDPKTHRASGRSADDGSDAAMSSTRQLRAECREK